MAKWKKVTDVTIKHGEVGGEVPKDTVARVAAKNEPEAPKAKAKGKISKLYGKG